MYLGHVSGLKVVPDCRQLGSSASDCRLQKRISFFADFSVRFQGFPIFCTLFMTINVHGHQIFAKCTLT